MSNSKICFISDRVHVHRWPKDTPIWNDSILKQLNDSINNNHEKKEIVIYSKTVRIKNIDFHSLKKIGISVPFFKDECRLIFEAQFGELFAHVHLIIKSDNFLDLFNQLMIWKTKEFPNNITD